MFLHTPALSEIKCYSLVADGLDRSPLRRRKDALLAKDERVLPVDEIYVKKALLFQLVVATTSSSESWRQIRLEVLYLGMEVIDGSFYVLADGSAIGFLINFDLVFHSCITYTVTILNSTRGSVASTNLRAKIWTHLLSLMIVLVCWRQSRSTFSELSRSERLDG